MGNIKNFIGLRACVLAIGLSLVVGCGSRDPGVKNCGYFGVVQQGETWSLVTPECKEFFSIGMNVVAPMDDPDLPGPKYDGNASHGGSETEWRNQTLQRLDHWSFNTLGAWSTIRGRPYAVELSLTYSWIDVFDEAFEGYVIDAAAKASERKDIATNYGDLDKDPLLIGYFTDNEIAWGHGYRWAGGGNYSLFEYYASMDPKSAGKQAWVSYMTEAYQHDWDRLSNVWNVDGAGFMDLANVTKPAPRSSDLFAEGERIGNDFVRRVAEQYFEVTSRVMRNRLPHHLNLGTRMTPGIPDTVVEVAARYVDILSVNIYTRELEQIRSEANRLHSLSQKPVLLTEFAFPARQNRSGNTNKGYKQAEVEDDRERAELYGRCVDMLSELPFVVGLHWFEYFDQPTNGRADGESVNFGFVDLQDRVYEDLASAATQANARALKSREGGLAPHRRAAPQYQTTGP